MNTLFRSFLSLMAIGALLLPPEDAFAADDDDDGGGSGSSDGGDLDGGASKAAKKSTGPTRRVREVVKGFYSRIGIGYLAWPNLTTSLGTGATSGGNAFDIAFGGDVVDQLGFTFTIEGDFFQGINNGVASNECGCESPVQGDFRTIGGMGRARFGFNFGGRKIRRWSAYAQVGGGVFVAPSLRPDSQGTVDAGRIHDGPGGIITGGGGLEYYTRLAHISVGVDFSVYVLVGKSVTPIGLAPTFFLKYTF